MFNFNFLSDLGRRGQRTIIISAACIVLLGVIAYASIPDSNGVIHGCYKKNGGTLRVVDNATDQCDKSELAVDWNQTGPQGLQGLQGPAGPQGPEGPQGPSGSAGSRQLTVSTQSGPYGDSPLAEVMPCADPIRSMNFVKQADSSRLRITYSDSSFALNLATAFEVNLKIDAQPTSPQLSHGVGISGGLGGDDFVIFGYLDGIAAGSHTLTSHYDRLSSISDLEQARCIRSGTANIEVEEIP